jgi:hypothetical protein
MTVMVKGGLFTAGFPPDSGDHIGLEIDGDLSEFCVYRVRGEFHCEEIQGLTRMALTLGGFGTVSVA